MSALLNNDGGMPMLPFIRWRSVWTKRFSRLGVLVQSLYTSVVWMNKGEKRFWRKDMRIIPLG